MCMCVCVCDKQEEGQGLYVKDHSVFIGEVGRGRRCQALSQYSY